MQISHILILLFIGSILFILLGEFLYLDMTGLGKKKAQREFASVITQMGFTENKDTVVDTWNGQNAGYNFTITPYSDATIMLEMKELRGLREISTAKGEHQFSSGNKSFDTLFPEIKADKVVAERIKKGHHFQKIASDFAKKWQRQSDYIEFRDDTISCSLKYGSSSYIPVAVLKEIVPEMAQLADAIQQDLGDQ